jgi:sugar phosphate isomerase/epimerase
MKLSFTTLGCPNWDLDTILQQAAAMGYDGVDFRGYLGELEVYRLPEFSTRATETARRFQDAGLEVPCFSSSARAFNATPEQRQASLAEVRAYAPVCAAFGARYLRIFAGGVGQTPLTQAIDSAARMIEAMHPIADDYGVRLVVETHDDWIDSELLRRMIGDLDGDLAGVLWDTHHPYRMHNEPPALTWLNLGRYVEYTHWHDSVPDASHREGYVYTHFGQGELPLAEMVRLLKNGRYDGWLAYEWEKRWKPELAEPEEAFPVFVRVMRRLLEDRE